MSDRGAESPPTLVLELARAEDAGDAHAFRTGPQDYLLRTGGGAFEQARLVWDDALQEELAALRLPGRDPELLRRVGDRLQRFLEPTSFRRWSAEILEAARAGRRVDLHIVSAAAELYTLPWELLTLADGRHLGEIEGLVLQYQWPQAVPVPPARDPRPEGGRLLFAWSRAYGNVGEAHALAAIEEAARAGHVGFARERDVLGDASLAGLVTWLERQVASGDPPALLHLLAHGAGAGAAYGLGMDDGRGGRELVDSAALRRALAPFAPHLRLVVLLACDSGNPGPQGAHLGSAVQELHRAGFEAVLGSRYPLSGAGALEFTRAFYSHLFEQTDAVDRAVTAARARLARGAGLDWASLQLYARPGRPCRPVVFRPHRGLLAFEREHTRFFFGRDAERREGVADLQAMSGRDRPRFLVVAGASGTGKSSVVLAGLVPDLEALGWTSAVMRPGGAPLRALDELLARRPAAGAANFLLVVDQFEEVFTHAAAGEAGAFAHRLWDMSRETGSRTHVLLTLRVDYLGRCGELVLDDAGLRLDRVAYDEAHRVFIAQMAPERLAETIDGPLARVGLTLEPGLGGRLLEDIGNDPNGLPLLQYALDELWKRRKDDALTHAALDAMGGVVGALTHHADAIVDGFQAGEQAQARRLLVRLVAYGGEPGSGTRRREHEAVLRPARDADAFARVTAALVDARLLVRRTEADGRATLEVAHEALIRHWERLWRWYQQDRDNLARAAELAQLSAQARQHGQLLTGKLLAHAEALVQALGDEASPDARAHVQESRAAETRVQRRRRLLLGGAVAGLVLTALVLLLLRNQAAHQAEIAEDERNKAVEAGARAHAASQRASDVTRLAVAAQQIEERPAVAAALLREVVDTSLPQWRQIAFRATQAALPARVLEYESERMAPVSSAALTSDGTEVVTGHFDGSIRVWPLGQAGTNSLDVLDPGLADDSIAARLSADVTHLTVQAGPDGDTILAHGASTLKLFRRRGGATALLMSRGHGDQDALFFRNPTSGRLAELGAAGLVVCEADSTCSSPRRGCAWLDPDAEQAACTDDQGQTHLYSWTSDEPLARLSRDRHEGQLLSPRARLFSGPAISGQPRRHTILDPDAGLLIDLPDDSDPLLDDAGLTTLRCAGTCKLCQRPRDRAETTCVDLATDYCLQPNLHARQRDLGLLVACGGAQPRLLFVDPVPGAGGLLIHEIGLPMSLMPQKVLLLPPGDRLLAFTAGRRHFIWDLTDIPVGIYGSPSVTGSALVPGTSELVQLAVGGAVAELRSLRFARPGARPTVEARPLELPAQGLQPAFLAASASHYAAGFVAPARPLERPVGAASPPARAEDAVLWGSLPLGPPETLRRGVLGDAVVALQGSTLVVQGGFDVDVVDLGAATGPFRVNVGGLSFDNRTEVPATLLGAAMHPKGDPIALAALGTDPTLVDRRAHRVDKLPSQGPTRCGEPNIGVATALAFAPNGRWLAIGYFAGRVEVLALRPDGHLDDTTPVAVLCHHQDTVRRLAFSADSSIVLSGTNRGEIAVWTDLESEPIVIALPSRPGISGLSLTAEHVIALTDSGELWWGHATFARDALQQRLERRARLCLSKAERMRFLLEDAETAARTADACPFRQVFRDAPPG